MSRKVARFVNQIGSVPARSYCRILFSVSDLTLTVKNFVKTAKDYFEFDQKIGRSRGMYKEIKINAQSFFFTTFTVYSLFAIIQSTFYRLIKGQHYVVKENINIKF